MDLGGGDRPSSTMTLLFTDIEGSTRWWEESTAMFEQVDAHFEVLRTSVLEGGGTLFAMLGDGVAAAFSSASAAVRAAVAAQRGLAPLELRVRMGLHTGEVQPAGEDLRGRSVNRAARVMALGNGGQILLSDVTAALVRSGPHPVDLVDLGTHRLRDLAEPERIWQVRHPSLTDAFPPLRGIDAFTNNLPRQRSSFVGREAELRSLVPTVRAHRVVTLTGVGGVGKTRLAVHAAAELVGDFANVWFVPLAAVADSNDVESAVAVAIGTTGTTDPLSAMRTLLAAQRTLLVIDNCEHVVEAAARVADALTASCPELHVLATGREALSIDGEQVVPVRPLDGGTGAADLFRERAAAAGADLTGVEHAAIEQLCTRLDGLPLAIELAAARTPSLGVHGVLRALDEGAPLEGSVRRGVDERHGTLRATIEWSYRLLDDVEQRFFGWLAAFGGGFELDVVDHVATAMGITRDRGRSALDGLVQRSMVVANPTAAGVRYRLLETMRSFALDQLELRDERPAARLAQAEWVAALCDLPPSAPCTPEVERRAIRLEREAESWREAAHLAAELGSEDLAARLCGPPAAWFLLGRHDVADLVHPLLDLCRRPSARRAVLSAMLVSASTATDIAQLQSWAREVEDIDEQDPTGLGGLMQWVALAWQGDFVSSVRVCVHAADDQRLALEVRDLFVGIAVLDHYSLTTGAPEPEGLVERALTIADRTDVALTRVLCRLGAAWALVGVEPSRSVALVHSALDDVARTPALTRLALPGSAARLLSGLAPSVAAKALLEQLDGRPPSGSFVDLVPLFYGAALLARTGQAADLAALSHVTAPPLAPTLSMMDFVDLARRASAAGDPGSILELESTVRERLVAMVDGELEGTPVRS